METTKFSSVQFEFFEAPSKNELAKKISDWKIGFPDFVLMDTSYSVAMSNGAEGAKDMVYSVMLVYKLKY